MACFIAPAAAAIVATKLKKRINPTYHLDWLIAMLWGGVAMLFIDHVANGEIVFYPPFLTAMKNPEDTINMFKEIAIVGGSMTLAVIVVWAVVVMVANKTVKRKIV